MTSVTKQPVLLNWLLSSLKPRRDLAFSELPHLFLFDKRAGLLYLQECKNVLYAQKVFYHHEVVVWKMGKGIVWHWNRKKSVVVGEAGGKFVPYHRDQCSTHYKCIKLNIFFYNLDKNHTHTDFSFPILKIMKQSSKNCIHDLCYCDTQNANLVYCHIHLCRNIIIPLHVIHKCHTKYLF